MIVVVFLAGLFIGTLLNMVVIRLPREHRLVGWPRCTRTGAPLALWQVVPVVGWAAQRGRARDGRRLNIIYPLIELGTALVLVLLYRAYGLSPLFFYLSFVCVVLIVTGAIDWLYRYIYTFVILGSMLVALLLHLLAGGFVPGMDILDSAMGAVVSGFVFVLFFLLSKILFPAASVPFGLGDVFLGLFIGAAVGFGRLPMTLFYGMLMAGVVAGGIVFAKYLLRRRDMPEYMPYGSYLCVGAILYLLVQGW